MYCVYGSWQSEASSLNNSDRVQTLIDLTIFLGAEAEVASVMQENADCGSESLYLVSNSVST